MHSRLPGHLCSYLEHAGLAIPSAALPAPASTGGAAPAGSGAVASESGIVVVNGATINVPLLQQRLVSLRSRPLSARIRRGSWYTLRQLAGCRHMVQAGIAEESCVRRMHAHHPGWLAGWFLTRHC